MIPTLEWALIVGMVNDDSGPPLIARTVE